MVVGIDQILNGMNLSGFKYIATFLEFKSSLSSAR